MGDSLYELHEVEAITRLTVDVISAADPSRSLATGLRLTFNAANVAVNILRFRYRTATAIQLLSVSPTASKTEKVSNLDSMLRLRPRQWVRVVDDDTLVSVGNEADNAATMIVVRKSFCPLGPRAASTLKIVHHAVDGRLHKQYSEMVSRTPRREQDVLAGIIRGGTDKEIAVQLGISHHTVHVYVRSLFKRYAVNSRSQFVARSLGAINNVSYGQILGTAPGTQAAF